MCVIEISKGYDLWSKFWNQSSLDPTNLLTFLQGCEVSEKNGICTKC